MFWVCGCYFFELWPAPAQDQLEDTSDNSGHEPTDKPAHNLYGWWARLRQNMTNEQKQTGIYIGIYKLYHMIGDTSIHWIARWGFVDLFREAFSVNIACVVWRPPHSTNTIMKTFASTQPFTMKIVFRSHPKNCTCIVLHVTLLHRMLLDHT